MSNNYYDLPMTRDLSDEENITAELNLVLLNAQQGKISVAEAQEKRRTLKGILRDVKQGRTLDRPQYYVSK